MKLQYKFKFLTVLYFLITFTGFTSNVSASDFTIATGIAGADSDTDTPGKPALASDGARFLVVSCRTGGIPDGLFGVFVNSDGSLSNEFHIAAHDCQSPHPALAYDGIKYLLVFSAGGAVYGTRITSTGSVLDGDTGFSISSGGSNYSPVLAFDGNNYLAVWQKYVNGGYRIYASRVTPAGQVLGEFAIFPAMGEQLYPALAFDGTNYLVAWQDTRSGSGEDTDVYATRVSPQGQILDPAGIAIATGTGHQGDSLAIDFDGNNYLVVWQDIPNPGFSPPVSRFYARQIRPDGTLLDATADTSGIPVNTAELGKTYLALGFDGTNHVIIWGIGAYNNSLPAGLYGVRMSTSGELYVASPLDTGFAFTDPPPDFSKFVYPAFLYNGNNSLLAWINNTELSGQLKSLHGLLNPHSLFEVSEYFPLHNDNRWTYLVNGSTQESQQVLAGEVEVGGILTRVLQGSDGITSYYTGDAHGVRLHRQFEPGVDFGDGIPRDFTVTYNPPLQIAQAQVNIGKETTATGTASSTVSGLGTFILNYSVTSVIVAIETVTVPLGNFPAYKVKTTLHLTGIINSENVNETEIDTYWLARHVGPVQISIEITGEPTDLYKLASAFIDTDADGIDVMTDNCPTITNPPQTDSDNDGMGNACDEDDDNDGIIDLNDALPLDADESVDTDHDGIGNNADTDDDGDGMPDIFETGIGLNPLDAGDADGDLDGDGATNIEEYLAGRNLRVNEAAIIMIINSGDN